MRLKIINRFVLLLAICVSMVFFMFGCGGGGGGSDGTVLGTGGSSSAGTGTVALLLADGPADDYEKILVTITEVLLIPSDDDKRDPAVIFRNPDGVEVDLLDQRAIVGPGE